jgi:hypothetical protein
MHKIKAGSKKFIASLTTKKREIRKYKTEGGNGCSHRALVAGDIFRSIYMFGNLGKCIDS